MSAKDSKQAFNSLVGTVQQYVPTAKDMVQAFAGDYIDPTARPTQIGSVSTQTVGSVPIFGSGAPVVPFENIDRMYLLQQQAKQQKAAQDAAVMGQAMPYYQLATANASKAFNAVTNSYIQNQFSKNMSAFAGQPDAPVKARKATASDVGFNTKLADFTAFQSQWNDTYGDVIAFMGLDYDKKDAKPAEYIPPYIRNTLTKFIQQPESLLESATKTGSFDLTEAGSNLDTIRGMIRPFKDVSAAVKTYVDELAKTVEESAPRKIRSTNQADMLETVKKEFYEAKPAQYAERIYEAHYGGIDKNSKDGKALMELITKMVDDQIATSVTRTTQTMSNGALEWQKWQFEKQKVMPVATTKDLGYVTKDATGKTVAKTYRFADYIPTQQKPINVEFGGSQTLYDPASGMYVIPIAGAKSIATVSGLGTFKKKFGKSEASLATAAFGGGKPWNGYSNQVNGHVAVVSLGAPQDQRVRTMEKVPTGVNAVRQGKKTELLTQQTAVAPQTMKVRIYDPSTGQSKIVNDYVVSDKTFLTSSQNVLGNLTTVDQGINLWLQERGGNIPASEQILSEKPAPK